MSKEFSTPLVSTVKDLRAAQKVLRAEIIDYLGLSGRVRIASDAYRLLNENGRLVLTGLSDALGYVGVGEASGMTSRYRLVVHV